MILAEHQTTSQRRLRSLLALILLLGATFLILPTVTRSAHGDPITKVAVSPTSIADLTVTSGTVQFSINVTNAPPIHGFLVQFSYNHTVLNVAPGGVSAAGVLGTNAQPLVECIDGISVLNTNCTPLDFLFPALAVVTLQTSIVGSMNTTAPTNGDLFSVTFNVVGQGVSQIHLLQVVLVAGFSAVPNVDSDGYFTNVQCGSAICQPPIPDFTFSPSPVFTNQQETFNASTSLSNNVGATFREFHWRWSEEDLLDTFTSGPVTAQTFQFSGSHIVILEATDTFGVTGMKSVIINVIPHPDFDITGSFACCYLLRGASKNGTLYLASSNGFAGNVSLSVNTLPSGLNISFASGSLELSSGGTNSTTFVASASLTAEIGHFEVTISATSGTLSHSVSIFLPVVQPTFFVSCAPPIGDLCETPTIEPGGVATIPIFVRSAFTFNGTVTLTAGSQEGLDVSISPSVITLTTGEIVSPAVMISTTTHTSIGDYFFNVRGTSGGLFSSTGLLVTLKAPPLPPDFSIQTPTSFTAVAGANSTINIKVKSLNGFNGGVDLFPITFPLFAPNQPFVQASPARVTLLPGGTDSVELDVVTTTSTIPGNYLVVVFGDSTSTPFTENFVPMTLTVIPPAQPVFAQLHWKQQVSLARTGGGQTFYAGVVNPNNLASLFVNVEVFGADPTGKIIFQANSGILQLNPGQTMTNIPIAQTLSPSYAGLTFTFKTVIQWGLSPRSLLNTSTTAEAGIVTNGSFTVIP